MEQLEACTKEARQNDVVNGHPDGDQRLLQLMPLFERSMCCSRQHGVARCFLSALNSCVEALD
jgi:hypothetical protein